MPWQFLVLQGKSIPSVPHLLRGMLAQRQFGGLAVHWRVFGSSGHIDPPLGGVLQVSPLTQCLSFRSFQTQRQPGLAQYQGCTNIRLAAKCKARLRHLVTPAPLEAGPDNAGGELTCTQVGGLMARCPCTCRHSPRARRQTGRRTSWLRRSSTRTTPSGPQRASLCLASRRMAELQQAACVLV